MLSTAAIGVSAFLLGSLTPFLICSWWPLKLQGRLRQLYWQLVLFEVAGGAPEAEEWEDYVDALVCWLWATEGPWKIDWLAVQHLRVNGVLDLERL
jgi:hypothetical protein